MVVKRRTLLGTTAIAMSFLLSCLTGRKSAAQTPAPEPRIDVSVCLDSATLLWVPFRAKGLPAGMLHRPLRRLDDGSLRSAVVDIPAGWSSGAKTRLKERIQTYVLTGELQVGERSFKKDTYLCNHPGRVMPPFGSELGARVLLVCDGPPSFDPAHNEPEDDIAIVIEDVPSRQPGRLWEDEATAGDHGLHPGTAGLDQRTGPRISPLPGRDFLPHRRHRA